MNALRTARALLFISIILLFCMPQVHAQTAPVDDPSRPPIPVRPEVLAAIAKGAAIANRANSGAVAPGKRAHELRTALNLFRGARDKAYALGNPVGVAASYICLGNCYLDVDDSAHALWAFHVAYDTFASLSSIKGRARALVGIGRASVDLERPWEALSALTEGLRLLHGTVDSDLKLYEAQGTAALSVTYTALGEFDNAVDAAKQALQMPVGPGVARNLLGRAFAESGKAAEAEDEYHKALAEYAKAHDLRGQAQVYLNVGNLTEAEGDYLNAYSRYEQALEWYRTLGVTSGAAKAMIGIGNLYQESNQQDAAIACYRSALGVLVGRDGAVEANLNLGIAYCRNGRPRETLAILRNCKLALERKPATRCAEHLLLGIAEMQLHRNRAALDSFHDALRAATRSGNPRAEADVLYNLAYSCEACSSPVAASAYLKRVLALAAPASTRCAALVLAGAIAEKRGDRAGAERAYRSSMRLAEGMHVRLGRLYGLKLGQFDQHLDAYHLLIRLLLREGRVRAAFEVTERAKARTLLDLLGSPRVELRRVLSPSERARELADYASLQQANQRFVAASLKVPADPARVRQEAHAVTEAERTYDLFYDGAQAHHTELPQAFATSDVTTDQLAGWLPPDTVLIETIALRTHPEATAADTLALFCAARGTRGLLLAGRMLPHSRAQISSLARAFAHSLVDPNNRVYDLTGYALYRELFGPTERRYLRGRKHVVFCVDSPLWSLPLHALWVRPGSKDVSNALLGKFSVSYGFSAASLYMSSRLLRVGDRPAATHSLLVVVSQDPPILPARAVGEHIAPGRGQSQWQTLKFAKDEGYAVARTVPGSLVLSGPAATKRDFMAIAGKYKYIHIAAHGSFNPAAPLMSSVALATAGHTPRDCLLTAREMGDLRLAADMVVLSACDTGMTRASPVAPAIPDEPAVGEAGVVGFAWALTAARVPTQVISLWGIDDRSTCSLMGTFYQLLFGDNRPRGKALALRQAALSVGRQRGHPSYWAGFGLYGDWR